MRPAGALRRLALILLTFALVCLPGCGQSVPDRAARSSSGEIQSLRFSSAAPEKAFSFCIYQRGEAYYFDADCPADAQRLCFAGREATAEDMERARELAAQYGVKSYLEAYRRPLLKLMPDAAAAYHTELVLEDGTCLSAETAGSWADAFESFFRELALRPAQ